MAVNLLKVLPENDVTVEASVIGINVTKCIKKIIANEVDGIILPFEKLERSLYEENILIEDCLKELDFIILPLSLFSVSCGGQGIPVEQNGSTKVLFCRNVSGHKIQIEKLINEKTIEVTQKLVRNKQLDFRTTKSFLGLPHHEFYKNDKMFLYDELILKKPVRVKLPKTHSCFFVTSRHNFHVLKNEECHSHIFFSGGMTTWERGRKQGIWFQGGSEGFGHEEIYNLRNSKCIQALVGTRDWFVLSRAGTKSIVGDVIGTYDYSLIKTSQDYYRRLKEIDTFFWTSGDQARIFMEVFHDIPWGSRNHACGLGRTLTVLSDMGLDPICFMNIDHFKNWVIDQKDEVSYKESQR